MKNYIYLACLCFSTNFFFSCNNSTTVASNSDQTDTSQSYVQKHLAGYATGKLTTDLPLSEKEKQIIPLLIKAAKIMDTLYWDQSYGHRDSLLNAIADVQTKNYITINYGPWDKLNNDTPFVAGVGPKPAGANFYPADMTKDELEKSNLSDKHGQY
jgi:hypothetical protein